MDLVDQAPGWNAIVTALHGLYGTRQPLHYAAMIPHRLGGPDPLDGISVYRNLNPSPHWHFVTFGFSELYDKEQPRPDVSGFGFELTFRLACDPTDEQPPLWALNLLQSLARYVFETRTGFAPEHHAPLHRPIAPGQRTELDALLFVDDPLLGAIDTPHGRVAFLQLVGVTSEEEAALDERGEDIVRELRNESPVLVTDIRRRSLVRGGSESEVSGAPSLPPLPPPLDGTAMEMRDFLLPPRGAREDVSEITATPRSTPRKAGAKSKAGSAKSKAGAKKGRPSPARAKAKAGAKKAKAGAGAKRAVKKPVKKASVKKPAKKSRAR